MSQTSLRLRVVPRYPASVTATDGLKTVRSGVDLVVKSDYSNLVQVADVPNPDKTFMLAWDSDIDNYQSISFTNIINNVQDAVIGPPLAAIDATNPGTDQVVYFTGEGEAATYTTSDFVRSISNAPDAGSFAATFGAMSASVYDPESIGSEVAFEATIGSFALVKNRVDYEWDVQDFAGSTFTDKMTDALQNTMEDQLRLRVPSGQNYLEDVITLDGTTATRRVSLHGDGPLASRLRMNGGKIIVNLTAWGQIDINNLWLDPVGNQAGDAPLQINWSGMASSRGFRIRNTHIGPTNAQDNVSNWFDNALKINGKGSGLIDGLWICGKSADAPLGNGIQIDNAKDVVIAHTVMYHLQKGLWSTDDGSSISEGIKFVHGTMVNMDYGIYLIDSTGLPNFELIGSHVAYNRRGVYLKGWTQNKLIDNLIYAENNSLETTQEDIYLDTCPATVVSRNQFFSGLDKATVPKIGLTLVGSSRNSRYEHNLFSERSLAIKLVDNGSSGIQDCVFENNRPERDLSGNPTVTTMVEISNSALHTRNRWIGEETEFSSTMSLASNFTTLAQNTWTTIPFGAVSGNTPALSVTASATTGEYTIPQNGITRGRIKAKARITTASAADAGSIGLRLMRNNGSGFTEIERISGGGSDTTLYLESREYAFAPGNSFRIEAWCSASGNATILSGAYLEFYPTK